MNGNEYKYDQLSIAAPPTSSALVVIYASETSHIPAWGKGEVAIQPFDQGSAGGYVEAMLPKTLAYRPDFFARSSIDGTFPPWEVHNRSSRPTVIQKGQKLGQWTAAVIANDQITPNKTPSSLLLVYSHYRSRVSSSTRPPIRLAFKGTLATVVQMFLDEQI